ncbi:hypothetical protein [Serratia quinivorans]|uniref:hypothetical protein n=1 Tax=Serratia quinivorans TaxID=137545 RepID=UPI003F96B620
MTRRKRWAFNEYLIAEAKKARSQQPTEYPHAKKSAHLVEKIADFAASIGLTFTELEAEKRSAIMIKVYAMKNHRMQE